MAARNGIKQESIHLVDTKIMELQESAMAIQDAQKHELASCFAFIEFLGEFEADYQFWQVVQVIVIITVVIWQILALRSYFIAKKLI